VAYVPVFIRPQSLRALIVGSGFVGTSRAKKLKGLGAEVTVVSLEDEPKLREYGIDVIVADARELSEEFFSRFHVVFVHTGNPDVNRVICEKVRRSGRFCDDPLDMSESDFIFPVYYANDVVQVAVTSYGNLTLFAEEVLQKIKEFLENEKVINLGKAVTVLKPLLKDKVKDPKVRNKLYRLIYYDSKFRELAERGEFEEARLRALEVIGNVVE
jgi:precorrin-2 dehydrogenase/sirohydrochlorin ferrochelatase